MLVESQSGKLMPHLLTAGPLLPCADFPNREIHLGQIQMQNLSGAGEAGLGQCGVLQLWSPKPEAALHRS